MSKINVLAVDRKNGRVTLSWEEWECVFAGKITGGIRMVSRAQNNKDRLHEEGWIPKHVFWLMYRQAGAILKDYAPQAQKRLASSLRT